MSARVKAFSSTLLHALREECHFALIEGVAFALPTVGPLVIPFPSGHSGWWPIQAVLWLEWGSSQA
jgi:hypothetical protein